MPVIPNRPDPARPEAIIYDFGLRVGGIASLYPLIKQTDYLKSKIRNLNSKIYT